MLSRNLVMALCAVAYAGAVAFSVGGLLLDPPMKRYVIVPNDDWTRCVELHATSERMARQEAARRPALAKVNGDCATLPSIRSVDSRLMLERGFNALLIVSALLASLWGVIVATRAWRRDAASPA